MTKMLTFRGARDTNINTGVDYDAVTFREIAAMAKNPPSCPKDEAQAYIPSSYIGHDGRTHSVQTENGLFHSINMDSDTGDVTLEQLDAAIVATVGDVSRIIYSSRGATQAKQKWRAIIPVQSPISGSEYYAVQDDVFDQMATHGIKLDRSLNRTGQPIYLPNQGEFYDYLVTKGSGGLKSIDRVDGLQERIKARAKREAAEAKAALAEAKAKAAERQRKFEATGELSPIDHFNAHNDIEALLAQHGWTPMGKGKGCTLWASPFSQSGGPSVRCYTTDQRCVSFTGSDVDQVGRVSKTGNATYDAFDVFVARAHGGNHDAAIRAVLKTMGRDKVSKPTAAQVLSTYDFQEHSAKKGEIGGTPTPAAEAQPEGGPTIVGPNVSQMKTHRIFTLSDAKPVLTSSYLIKGWLGRSGMSVVYGPSNVGKSFFCLDMAFSIAANVAWNGARVKGGAVLYLATEGGDAFRNRLYALKEAKGVADAPLLVRPSPIDLLRAEVDMPSLVALCNEVEAKIGEIKMIVVDTLSRAMAGGNENGPEDMTRFIGNLDTLRDVTGAHIMVVHHSGKDTAAGARGHSSLRAATDTEIEMEVDETDLRTAKNTKQRDMEPQPPFGFKLEVHQLGVDEDGDPVTTCTILPASDEDVADAKAKRPTGTNQITVMKAFKQLRGDGVGRPNPAGTGWPEAGTRWCIPEDELKRHAIGKLSDKTNPDSAYSSAIKGLISGGFMERNDGHLWCLSKEGRVT